MKLFENIHLFLGNISGTLKLSLFRNKLIFEQVKPFLAAGTYKNSLYCDYIYKVGLPRHFDKKTFSSTFALNKYARKIVIIITNLVRYKNKHENEFCGTEVIISSGHSEYKVFDIKKELVLTYYNDQNKLSLVAQNKNKFRDYFNVTKTTDLNVDKHILIEQFIKQCPFEKEKALIYVIKQYKQYVKSQAVNCSTITDLYCQQFKERFGDSSLLKEVKQYPSVFSHGDLWSSNIMFDGKVYYITDFEAAEHKYILFDFFMYIFSEYVVYNDIVFIDNYFIGRYDNILSDVMESAEAEFTPNSRGSYILAFLVEIVNERWESYHSIDDKIIKILKEYIQY